MAGLERLGASTMDLAGYARASAENLRQITEIMENTERVDEATELLVHPVAEVEQFEEEIGKLKKTLESAKQMKAGHGKQAKALRLALTQVDYIIETLPHLRALLKQNREDMAEERPTGAVCLQMHLCAMAWDLYAHELTAGGMFLGALPPANWL